ncbi:putative protein of unknown function (DUF4246) [Lyophyllum shimeji]|uniref:Uncharacterized protein n=1 Tax=Lyophyllum shimeji TaxID=47721 RepID=A0A9P3ULD8_LYOSH|nr:putative protein of unknown function (DUF4246) [Lyophyllum shimeji]
MASGVKDAPRSSEDRIQLPGFGLPLNSIPTKSGAGDLFRSALDGGDLYHGYAQLRLTTLREFTMLQFMNQLTDKPNWHQKVFDETITSKWKAETLEWGEDDGDHEHRNKDEDMDEANDEAKEENKDEDGDENQDEDENGDGDEDDNEDDRPDITEKMVDWCIEEVKYKAKIFEKTGAISVYNGDVVKSDVAIPESLKEALKAATASLEDVPARDKDWHPGSDEKVLDLVHPSLFPLIYGRSRILPDSAIGLDDCPRQSGGGVVIPVPPEEETIIPDGRYVSRWNRRTYTTPFSRQFQWLPSDVKISGGEGCVRITSYINNLHPDRHRDLYGVIEQIVARTIPLWNMTLTPLRNPEVDYHRIKYTECEYDPDPEYGPETEGPQLEDYEDEDEYYEQREEWYQQTRVVVRPEPGDFVPPPEPTRSVDIWRDYAESGLQVIVKLANIHLTPEKPSYEGGTWHVEGQLNEHICASAIYYYDNENITTSRLAFRQQSDPEAREIRYRQGQHDWLEIIFGCRQEGPGVQDIGTVDTPEGRLLTWPNILQHRVQPFELEDPTKPGHRKILALFLVDPNTRIISTANVPPQRRDWWSEQVRKGDHAVSRLPAELQDHVLDAVEEFPISLEDAKELRLKLMEERKVFVVKHDEAFRQHEFSLCEH